MELKYTRLFKNDYQRNYLIILFLRIQSIYKLNNEECLKIICKRLKKNTLKLFLEKLQKTININLESNIYDNLLNIVSFNYKKYRDISKIQEFKNKKLYNEYQKSRVQKIKNTKLKRYNNPNFNNIEKKSKNFKRKIWRLTFTLLKNIKNRNSKN